MEEAGSVELLKVDTKGRVRVTRERREALLEEYDRRGMSAAQFAQWAGIKYPTFATWVQGRRREQEKAGQGGPKEAVAWVEAVLDEGKSRGATVVVHLPCGARMEVADENQAALAAEVLRHLAGKTRC